MSSSSPAHSRESNMEDRQLRAVLPSWCILNWQSAATCALFVATFLYFCYLPLPVDTIWTEIEKGRQVSAGEQAAETLPFAAGLRDSTSGWLGDLAIYRIFRAAGIQWLAPIAAIVHAATLVLLTISFWKFCRRGWVAVLAIAVLLAGIQQMASLGASSFGLLLFAVLLLSLSTIARDTYRGVDIRIADSSMWIWLVAPGIIALWANLDESVWIGVALVLILFVGRLIEVCLGRVDQKWSDSELHFRGWMAQLCVLATLLQPEGMELWRAACWQAQNPVHFAWGGQSPLVLGSWQGMCFCLGWLVWLAASRFSKQLPAWNVLMALAVSVLAVFYPLMITWFAAVMMFLAAALIPVGPTSPTSGAMIENPRPLQFAFTLVCGLLIWVGFSLSPFGSQVLGGDADSSRRVLVADAPVELRSHFAANPPQSNVFTPSYWTDFLRSGGAYAALLNLDNSKSTDRIREDYRYVSRGGADWKRILDRYAIGEFVIDKSRQSRLLKKVRRSPGTWKRVFEDSVSVVYRRTDKRKPVPVIPVSHGRTKRNVFGELVE